MKVNCRFDPKHHLPSVDMPETNQSKVSSIMIHFQTRTGTPGRLTASASFYFPPSSINTACDCDKCFPTKFLLYQINHARNNHFSGLCPPVMLQVVRLRSFPLEPKALTFSHQQLALKHLSLCSSCAPGGKEEWKPPITKLAYASLLSDLIFLTQILPFAKKLLPFFSFFFSKLL